VTPSEPARDVASEAGEVGTDRGSERENWLMAEEAARQVFEGTCEEEQVLDLAMRFLEQAPLSDPEWAQDGSIRFPIEPGAVGDEFGSAALHVYPGFQGKEGEFVLKLNLKESPGYLGPLDAAMRNGFDMSFGVADGELQAKAQAFTLTVPTESLRQQLAAGEALRTGGIATFGPDSLSWQEISMKYHAEADGTPVFRQEFLSPYERTSPQPPPKRAQQLASLLKTFRARHP
jgi:hypothetical protein